MEYLQEILHQKHVQLQQIKQIERYNSRTRLGEDFQGKSLATLTINVHEARDLEGKHFVVEILLDDFKRKSLRTSAAKDSCTPAWMDTLVFEEISNADATIRVRVLDTTDAGLQKVVGQARIPLSSLRSQQKSSKWYTLSRPPQANVGSVLLSTQFKYSNILPLEMDIAALQKDLSIAAENASTESNASSDEANESTWTKLSSYLAEWLLPEEQSEAEVESSIQPNNTGDEKVASYLAKWFIGNEVKATQHSSALSITDALLSTEDSTLLKPSDTKENAITRFFLPSDQKTKKTKSKTHFDPAMLLPIASDLDVKPKATDQLKKQFHSKSTSTSTA